MYNFYKAFLVMTNTLATNFRLFIMAFLTGHMWLLSDIALNTNLREKATLYTQKKAKNINFASKSTLFNFNVKQSPFYTSWS